MSVELLAAAAPRRWPVPRAKTVLFAAIGLMYGYVMWRNERFLFRASDPEWQHIAPFKTLLLPHVLAASLALFLGPLQFSERLRRNHTKLHKVAGYLYIAGCYIGAPLGAYIKWYEERLGMSRNFTIATVTDAAIWIFATTMALIMIRSRKYQQHRVWMVRSFACALIFLEVRTILDAFGLPQMTAEIALWVCVAAAFPLADLALQLDDVTYSRGASGRLS